MKNIFATIALFLGCLIAATGCYNNPVDDDGLLITNRDECYVSNFDLTGTDHLTVRVGDAIIDNDACTIHVTVAYGTDLRHLHPRFSLVTDAILEPKITGITDFSDLENPHKYTVVSGSRRVRKTYTVFITVQQPH
ncbi:MAG: hypothetical protein K2F77_08565 [Muribaculaceae bacterium]|nr:hypothetical protein [Muribaculaceae bacterium]